MKILDRYILTTYLKTFISVFVILMLIFVLQTIWLYIKELAGKDLDLITVFEFLIYFSPKLIPLVLPLTILLSSIMVFGNFAENYEFAAMKSTGISLQRAMRGLGIFIAGIGILTFFFANNVIPWSEYNSYNLRQNIKKRKPAMVIAEGQFNQIGDNFNIKVEEKSGDRGQYFKDVTIHKKTSKNSGNHITIKSKTGELKTAEASDVLQLILHDGNYYDDTPPKDRKEKLKRPFVKSAFKEYIINVDLSTINEEDLGKRNHSGRHSMLNITDLNYTIDSLSKEVNTDYVEFAESLHNRSGIVNLDTGLKPIQDSIYNGKVLDMFTPKKAVRIIELAINTVTSTGQIIKTKDTKIKVYKKNINLHLMALHEKFAIGFACIILFFVGAPLGALIRKGGIGLPMIIAILLFLTYHFIGIFAKNSARDGTLNPIFASWFSTLIMFPLGLFLSKRATADRGLFEFGNIIEPLKKFLNIKSSEDQNKVDYSFFKDYNNDKLYSIVKNPKQFNFEETGKVEALNLLLKRGLSTNDLKLNGIQLDDAYNKSIKLYNNHTDYSKYSLIFYSIGAILLVLFFVFKNNKLPSLASTSIQLSMISFFSLIVYYVITFVNLSRFFKYIKQKKNASNLLSILLGLPFYPITHFLNKNKVLSSLKQNCLDSLK